jgi:bifunctional non-homologous end joining protein LigD
MDTTSLRLDERKALLLTILRPLPRAGLVRFCKHMDGDGKAVLTEACRLGLNGIVSKKISTPCRSVRRGDWLKAKWVQIDEFVIAGYLDSSAVENAVGTLVLSYYDGNKLVYAGRVGTGFSQAKAREQ